MRYAVWVMLCSIAYAANCPADQQKKDGALVEIEHRWAASLDTGDTAALDCILAAEFEDAGPDGKLTERTYALDKAAHHKPIRHELSDLHAHVNGDVGYIRGLATAVDQKGKVLVRVRFTDIYEYREGRWLCLAAHESIIADEGHID